MEGVAMGGSVAGPFGAIGGLTLGLIFGLSTADSYYEDLNGQIQTEQAKDKELEAQLEQELERQRELEAKLEKREGAEEPEQKERETETAEDQDPSKGTGETQSAKGKEEVGSLASLGKLKTDPGFPTSSFKNVKVRDVDGDGVPDLWVTYNPLKPDEVIRKEEDTNWDGRVDSWSYFANSKLVRREVDTDGDGGGDRTFFYKNESLTKEERDEDGDGRPSYRAIYENRRLAMVEKDLNKDGKMNLWIYYDTDQAEQVVIKEERDFNGDGAVDIWSYYEDGRLVRRDVSAVGLDYLSKEEKPQQEVLPQTLPKG
jgi:hypothetical protein